ncbi:hypothetical protein [Streptomyces sp. NPDC002758]
MVDKVAVDLDRTADGQILVTLTSPSWVLNIEAPRAELEQLASIADTDWNARRTLSVGACANTRVYWCTDPDSNAADQAAILIGHDDESWDICISVPQVTVQKIAELATQFPST